MVRTQIEPNRSGLFHPTKGDYPVRYGERTEIRTADYTVELDKNGRIKFLTRTRGDWPGPNEFLKRTDANDWVYYSNGEYTDLFGLYGEYYLPCPDYPTNRPIGGEPFRRSSVQKALAEWYDVVATASQKWAETNEPSRLAEHGRALHQIIDSSLPVLPPDARHVDYDVVPLVVADGCRYGCRFCCVNDHHRFQPRTKQQIDDQISGLEVWLGGQAGNIQGLFLGLHDALGVDEELLKWSIERAFHRLGFANSRFLWPQLYFFGSVASILSKKESIFEWLNQSPWSCFINVGLESPDQQTLNRLGKPLSADEVRRAFRRIVELNARYPNIEVTTNFVLFSENPASADEAIIELINENVPEKTSRGACYLSPLMVGSERPRSKKRPLLQRIYALQRQSRVPLFLYLIQRL